MNSKFLENEKLKLKLPSKSPTSYMRCEDGDHSVATHDVSLAINLTAGLYGEEWHQEAATNCSMAESTAETGYGRMTKLKRLISCSAMLTTSWTHREYVPGNGQCTDRPKGS